MRLRHILLTTAAILLAGLFLIFFLPGTKEAVGQLAAPQATLAPTATAGAPAAEQPEVYPTLAQPLDTEDQALQRALYWDSKVASRDQVLSATLLRSQPGRVTIEWYADRDYDGSDYGPGAERGPIWVVTINGSVRVDFPGSRGDVAVGSVTYVIAQRTGDLLGIKTSK